MMTEDEVIEQWSQRRFGVFHDDGHFEEFGCPAGYYACGDQGYPWSSHPLKDRARWVGGRPDQELLRACLASLRPGDRLQGGLMVVREEPTEAMVVAGCRHVNMGDPSLMAGRYKAMLAAQEDG